MVNETKLQKFVNKTKGKCLTELIISTSMSELAKACAMKNG